MEQNKLLEQAREAFYKEYAQTPEDAGFPVVRCWNNEVVFAKNEQVFTALQQGRKLIKTGLGIFLIIILIWVIGLVLSIAFSGTIFLNNLPSWVILIGFLIFFVICTGIQIKCNAYENIYLKEGCHLIYNGKKFYTVKQDDTINAHKLFF